MGIALAIFFVICIVLIAINQNSEESAAIKSQTQKLPEVAFISFDKKVSGRSRKVVVTYYSHFVRAAYKCPDGTSLQQVFPFDHHDHLDKASAWGRAHEWSIATHSTVTANSLPEVTSGERFEPGVTTLDQLIERLGEPETTTGTSDGHIAVVWSRPKASLDANHTNGVTIIFDNESRIIRIVKRNEMGSEL